MAFLSCTRLNGRAGSMATEGKKDENWAKKINFLAEGKSLSHFIHKNLRSCCEIRPIIMSNNENNQGV